MKFEELLNMYEDILSYANRMMKPKCLSFYKKTKDYWEGYKKAANKMFEEGKGLCEDFKPLIIFLEMEGHDFLDTDDRRYKAAGVLEYRNEKFYIYINEDEQTLFTVCNNKVIKGGHFSFNSEFDICYQIDLVKDNIQF